MSESQPAATMTESIDDQDPNLTSNKKANNRRPGNTAFRQQRLKAWQPILTPKTVLPLFFAIGIIFAPIGGGLLYASANVQEIVIDYSKCGTEATNEFSPMPSNLVTMAFNQNSTGANSQTLWKRQKITYNYGPGADWPTIQCSIQFNVPSEMGAPILFYYQLTNFYQNHRRYVKSLNTDQLSGDAVDNNTIHSSACTPLTVAPNGKPYYPCGLIANSIFNDTFYNPILLTPSDSSADNETYYMANNTEIAWSSDKSLYGTTKYTPDEIEPPPNWINRWPNGYTEDHPPPDLHTDQAFQVWMRTAGLPNFSKLYQRNDTTPLKVGTYQIDLNDNFNVTKYGGTKSIIISTSSVVGGKNPFLGIAYVVVGGICILLGAVFTITYVFKPRKLGDHNYLSWNNDHTSTATTSGRETRGGPADVRSDVA